MGTFKVAKYIGINLKIMSVLGYLEPKNITEEYKVVYKYYTIFVTFTLCLFDILTCLTQMFLESEIEKATNILFVLLAKVTLLVKILAIQMNQKKILYIIYKNRPEFLPDDEVQVAMFQRAAAYQKNITIIFHFMGIIATLTMCFFPFIDPGMSGKLPFAAWYPFSIDGKAMYRIIFAYQTVCLLFMSLAHVATDMLISGLLMVTSNQLEILRYQIVNIKSVSSKGGRRKDVNSRMLSRLVECVQHYNATLEFADAVHGIFSLPLFFLFCLGVGAIGVTLFQFILTPILTMEFFSIAIYQACVLLEIFLYCFYGNSIMVESDTLTNALHHCGWENGSLEFQREVNRFMTRTQKSYTLYAGNFFPMSLPNFILILKSSWSYFTLLHRLHEKGE